MTRLFQLIWREIHPTDRLLKKHKTFSSSETFVILSFRSIEDEVHGPWRIISWKKLNTPIWKHFKLIMTTQPRNSSSPGRILAHLSENCRNPSVINENKKIIIRFISNWFFQICRSVWERKKKESNVTGSKETYGKTVFKVISGRRDTVCRSRLAIGWGWRTMSDIKSGRESHCKLLPRKREKERRKWNSFSIASIRRGNEVTLNKPERKQREALLLSRVLENYKKITWSNHPFSCAGDLHQRGNHQISCRMICLRNACF